MDLAVGAQTVSIMAASWAIISGIGAWKREHIGKRKIELAERVLGKFFEVRDAFSFIRNPFSFGNEGSTRKRNEHESSNEAGLLDRAFIVHERYSKREGVFNEFRALKYPFMASFGSASAPLWETVERELIGVFVSARQLATHYWQRQGRVHMEGAEFERHLEEMNRHEAIFWEQGDSDPIRKILNDVQSRFDELVQPCFVEPASSLRSLASRVWHKIRTKVRNR